MINLREELLKTCFERYEGEFAAGTRANNKMNIDRLAESPRLRNYVTRLLGSLAVVESVDFIAAVPNGANWIAQEVADTYSLPFVELFKHPDTKEIDFLTEDDYILAQLGEQGLLVEDVASTFYTIRKCLALKRLNENVVVVASIFDRGNVDARTPLPVKYRALAREYIPPSLPEDSKLWEYTDGKR